MLLALLLATPPAGTLTLDRDDPVVTATIAGQPFRLRVALDQHAVVELNPDAAARLATVSFEADGGVQIGRVALAGRVAGAFVTIQGRRFPARLSSYPRACCAGVDGEIPPDLLPFTQIRFTRAGGGGVPVRTITLTMERDPGLALFTRAATPGGAVLAMFSLAHDATLATGAGGAVLARAGSGRFTGPAGTETRAFGIARPVRTMLLDRAVTVAGFPIARALVRTADFRGGNRLPALPQTADDAPSDIRITARQRAPQRAIPAVIIGRDLLGACPDIRFDRPSRRLTLSCT